MLEERLLDFADQDNPLAVINRRLLEGEISLVTPLPNLHFVLDDAIKDDSVGQLVFTNRDEDFRELSHVFVLSLNRTTFAHLCNTFVEAIELHDTRLAKAKHRMSPLYKWALRKTGRA